jgi:hypothetical protein
MFALNAHGRTLNSWDYVERWIPTGVDRRRIPGARGAEIGATGREAGTPSPDGGDRRGEARAGTPGVARHDAAPAATAPTPPVAVAGPPSHTARSVGPAEARGDV